MALISVIIPVYKTEQYLERCIQSVLAQTLTDIEVILVDDGSPDRCGEICESYAQRDCRIRVIHQENQGLSVARNMGIANARSPYVGLVDSDDWIHPEMYRVLYEALKEGGAQIAVCDSQRILEGQDAKPVVIGQAPLLLSGKQALENMLVGNTTGGHTAWNKLYDIRLFDKVLYPAGKLYEDAYTTYRLLFFSQTVVYCPARLYYYQQRRGSIMARGFGHHSMDKMEAAEQVLDFVRSNIPELLAQAEAFQIVSALRVMVDILDDGKCRHPQEFKLTQEILLRKESRSNRCLSRRHRFLLRLFWLSPGLYRAVWHVRFRTG